MEKNAMKPVWSYSPYRALLRRNDKSFAIVTPDGSNALPEEKIAVLLRALNGEQKPALTLTEHPADPKFWSRRYSCCLCGHKGRVPVPQRGPLIHCANCKEVIQARPISETTALDPARKNYEKASTT
jgi:hypothetical protein